MKKIYILSLSILMCIGAFAQDRTCGTMTALENRMEKDPSLKQTHEAYEKATQEWVKQHEKPTVVSEFPSIEGFTPTGNRTEDQIKYAAAKSAYQKKQTATVPSNNSATHQNNGKKKNGAGFVAGSKGGSK